MSQNEETLDRRKVLRSALMGTVAIATGTSFLDALTSQAHAAGKGSAVLDLQDGRRLHVKKRGNTWQGFIMERNGREVKNPSGQLKLKNGKSLLLDKGRVQQGDANDWGFNLFADFSEEDSSGMMMQKPGSKMPGMKPPNVKPPMGMQMPGKMPGTK